MKNFLKTVLIVIYSLIAIFVTVLLLSYNEYKLSVLGGYTFYLSTSDLGEEYKAGDLILIKECKKEDIKVGDKIFVYRTLSTTEFEIFLGEVTEITEVGINTAYTLNNEHQFDSTYVIGKQSNALSYPKVGMVLSILESKWGFLFCIVVVTLLLLLQEILNLIEEIRYGERVEEEIKKVDSNDDKRLNNNDDKRLNNNGDVRKLNSSGNIQKTNSKSDVQKLKNKNNIQKTSNSAEVTRSNSNEQIKKINNKGELKNERKKKE